MTPMRVGCFEISDTGIVAKAFAVVYVPTVIIGLSVAGALVLLRERCSRRQ